jgi:hypothetical protein
MRVEGIRNIASNEVYFLLLFFGHKDFLDEKNLMHNCLVFDYGLW